MVTSNQDIAKWTKVGLSKGAKAMLIVKAPYMEDCYPVWIMPGESLENIRSVMEKDNYIVDGVNIAMVKELLSDTSIVV